MRNKIEHNKDPEIPFPKEGAIIFEDKTEIKELPKRDKKEEVTQQVRPAMVDMDSRSTQEVEENIKARGREHGPA